jgi:signal recognition particle subunit SRP19
MLTNNGGIWMRKLDKAIIWPVYFDVSKTRKNGRRVPKSLAVQSLKIDEIKMAVDQLGLKNEVRAEAHFSRLPWVKTGMLLVEKKEAKQKVMLKIAKQLMKIKSAQLPAKPLH